MMQVRLFTAAVLVAVGLLGAPAAALAADPAYPPTAVTGGVNTTVVSTGGAVKFSGTGFRPAETILLSMSRNGEVRDLGTASADSLGAFELSAQVTAAGRWVLTATGSLTGNVLTAEVLVRARAAASDDTLPVTGRGGSHWLTLLSVGLVAIALGTVLVRRSRRRGTTV